MKPVTVFFICVIDVLPFYQLVLCGLLHAYELHNNNLTIFFYSLLMKFTLKISGKANQYSDRPKIACKFIVTENVGGDGKMFYNCVGL